MARVLLKVDKNGTKYWGDYTCRRCGGAGGSDKWQYTGWKCYECGGSGKSDRPDIYKEYTPEYQAKLDARRAKRQAKRIAELEAKADETRAAWLEKHQFDADGFTFLFTGNTYDRKDEIKAHGAMFDSVLGWHIAKPVYGFDFVKVHIDEVATPALAWGYTITASKADVDAMKAPKQEEPAAVSEHVGNVGDRITFAAKYTHCAYWEIHPVAWQTATQYLHTFTDENGNVFVWKTTNGLALEVGDAVTVTGTIKEHGEYNDVKQTVLQRCKVKAGE